MPGSLLPEREGPYVQDLCGNRRRGDEHCRRPEEPAAPARLAVLERIVEKSSRAPRQGLEIREGSAERDVHADASVHCPAICLQHRPERPLPQLEPGQQHTCCSMKPRNFLYGTRKA